MRDTSPGRKILDATFEGLRAGCVFESLELLRTRLLDFRANIDPELWSCFAKECFTTHPIRPLLHQSPFARRSFEKPRGYPGDAVLLDYIYNPASIPATSALGGEIAAWEAQTQSCRSVRARKDILAEAVDQAASEFSRTRIVSLACGHLREAQQARAVREGRMAQYVGIDQDGESLAVVEREQGADGVTICQDSVRSLLTGRSSLRAFHLAYAAGLYDYLATPVATRLTLRLFQMLAPGGKLLVANFHPRLPDIAGMETMMGWWLTYRDEKEVEALAGEIDPREIDSQRTFRDPHGNLVFLEIRRR
jgi:extracellular factor (EF) 3-hydroxypalmitic acid methyl ester biosynthesis protein